jgi:oligopeptide transport system substrate-binding protein
MKQPSAKGWNRRAALLAGGAAAAGVAYLALKPGKTAPRHVVLEPGTFYRGNGADPMTLDPSLADATWEDSIVGDLMVGLVTEDERGRGIPGIAESWTTSPDGLTWTFKLRDALWSDGVPVTADDFVFSWARVLDPQLAASYAYFPYVIKNAEAINAKKMPPSSLGARALDARTLEVHLEHPAPYLPEMLMHTSMYPEPRHVVEKKGRDWPKPGNYVCNGAFMLTEWVPNGHVTVVKNPRFYDAENVALEKVIYYPTDDYSAAMRRLQAGELDVQDRLPGQEIDYIKAHMPEMIDPVPQMIVDLVSVNLGRKPFDDIRVREAINLAINREALTDKITHVGYVPAYNLIPPGTANFPGGNVLAFKNQPAAERLERARMLMREAGYGPDNRLKTSYMIRSTAAGSGRSMAAAIQQMLSLIYISMTIEPNDAAIFYKRLQVHDFDIGQPGWSADFNDASNFLDLFKTGNPNNWGAYSTPAFDAALAAAQNDANSESRGRKLADAEAILLKDQAFMPLFFWVSPNLVRPYVKGWVGNNLDKHRSRWISFDQKARSALFV